MCPVPDHPPEKQRGRGCCMALERIPVHAKLIVLPCLRVCTRLYLLLLESRAVYTMVRNRHPLLRVHLLPVLSYHMYMPAYVSGIHALVLESTRPQAVCTACLKVKPTVHRRTAAAVPVCLDASRTRTTHQDLPPA